MNLSEAQAYIDANKQLLESCRFDNWELRWAKLMVKQYPQLLARTQNPQVRAIIKERHKRNVAIVLAALLEGEE